MKPNSSQLYKKITQSIGRLNDPHARFILGVSGGPDSQVLLKAFPHVLRRDFPTATCVAVSVNHGLRPEAPLEQELARKLADSVSVPFHVINLQVPAGGNIQARARQARYDAIRDFAGRDPIVTAHHYEDRAETVLIRLLRGKRFGSLAVLPELSGQIFRPMLSVRKSEINAYLDVRLLLTKSSGQSRRSWGWTRKLLSHEPFWWSI